MQCMILVAVAGWVWAGVGVVESAVTCENVASCTPDVQHLSSSDPNNKADLHQSCLSIRTAMQCFREAMADCRANTAIPEETLTQLESQMNQYDLMLEGHCGPNAYSSAQGDAPYTGTDENKDDSGSNSSGVFLASFSAATILTCLLVLFL